SHNVRGLGLRADRKLSSPTRPQTEIFAGRHRRSVGSRWLLFDEFYHFGDQLSDLGALAVSGPGIATMLKCVLVLRGGSGSFGTAMHATSAFAEDCRGTTGRAPAGPGSATRTGQHRASISRVIASHDAV